MTDLTDTQKLAKIKVDKMITDLRKGKDIHEQFAQAIQDRMTIQGKTIEQWRNHFKIKIPDNPDIVACKAVDMQLMGLYQEASFLKAMAEAAALLQKKGYDTQYRERFEALVSQYRTEDKKLPAKETLEALARNNVDEVETGLAYAELAVRFWKEIVENLNYLRKIIENVTINNSVESRVLRGYNG
jgi:hypothetical protein